jgi:putative flippase GtrA
MNKQNIIDKAHKIVTHNFAKKFYLYFLIGIVGVVVDTAVTNIFYNFIFIPMFAPKDQVSINTYKTISALIGGFVGIINNFILNDFFVYKIKNGKGKLFGRFFKYVITIVFGGWLIGKVVILNMAGAAGIGLTVSNILAIAAGMVINYPINYFWTWKTKPSSIVD